MPTTKTIVINAAGVGSRLGLGITKCLLEVRGKSILARHLTALQGFTDIRIAVGYRAEDVMREGLRQCRDILFVFNHDYRNTGTLCSLANAARFARHFVISIDGDLILRARDLRAFCEMDGPVIGVCRPCTAEPVYASVKHREGSMFVDAFSREKSEWEWTGLLQVPRQWIKHGPTHVYETLMNWLPIKAIPVETREIDTYEDYKEALRWAEEIDL